MPTLKIIGGLDKPQFISSSSILSHEPATRKHLSIDDHRAICLVEHRAVFDLPRHCGVTGSNSVVVTGSGGNPPTIQGHDPPTLVKVSLRDNVITASVTWRGWPLVAARNGTGGLMAALSHFKTAHVQVKLSLRQLTRNSSTCCKLFVHWFTTLFESPAIFNDWSKSRSKSVQSWLCNGHSGSLQGSDSPTLVSVHNLADRGDDAVVLCYIFVFAFCDVMLVEGCHRDGALQFESLTHVVVVVQMSEFVIFGLLGFG